MDNDNKIVPKKSTTGLFLDDLDVKAVSERDDYVLHEEFKASKSNKNWGIVFILAALTLGLAAGAWGITRWIEARNVIRDYELDEFQDVDLMDVLNQVRKIELALEEAERKLVILRREYQNAIVKVEEEAAQETTILESSDISQEDLDSGMADIGLRKGEALQAVDDQYLEQIAILEEEIQVLREQMSAYDAEKVQQAQEYEAVIANEQQKFEMEKQQLIDSYEAQLAEQEQLFNERLSEYSGFQDDLESTLRNTSAGRQSRLFMLYNPLITEDMEGLTDLVEDPVDEERFDFNMYRTDPQWIERGYLSYRDVRYLQNNVTEWRELMGFMNQIPFENSVPDVLSQLEYRYLDLLDTVSFSTVRLFESLSQVEDSLTETSTVLSETESRLSSTAAILEDTRDDLAYERREVRNLTAAVEEVKEENEVIRESFIPYENFYDWFSYSMTLRLRDLGGQGILLQPGADGELLAFMDPFLEIPGGVSGFVFGLDNEYIGEIRLDKEDLFYRGSVLHQEEGSSFSSFDRIFLRISSLTDEGSDE